MDERISAVRAYAKDHYEEDGWDYVVECFSDTDILEEIAGAMTPEEAIELVRQAVKVLDDRRKDVQAEVFLPSYTA